MKFPDVSELGRIAIEGRKFTVFLVDDAHDASGRPLEVERLLRDLVVTVGDYMWEVSARDDRGRCRRCDAPEGQAHIGTCVVMRLSRAHLAAADLLWWLDHPNTVNDRDIPPEARDRAERLRDGLRARGEWR